MLLAIDIKKVIENKCTAVLIALFFFVAYPNYANAFTCKDSTGGTIESTIGSGEKDVYADLTPVLQSGQVLVVDLSKSIFCKNDNPDRRNDSVTILSGSAYSGVLNNFIGSLAFYGSKYDFPTNNQTNEVSYNSGSYSPWDAQLYLTPISTAGGILISQGDLIAKIIMRQYGSRKPYGDYSSTAYFTWNIYASNSVFVPTGGCNVSSRNITVDLPDYPGSAEVPLTVYCAKDQKIAYYLTGSTVDAASTIFANISSSNSAAGIGVQLSNDNGVIATNKNISLGIVGNNSMNLKLTASYARTSGQVVAGNVQSIVGITFIYE